MSKRHEHLKAESIELLRLNSLEDWALEIPEIASNLVDDVDSGYSQVVQLDKKIPGLGLHNINIQAAGGHMTGNYLVEDRPIFRGIQYVGMHLRMRNPEWVARMTIVDACYHVEGCLKRKTKVNAPLSVGMILHRLPKMNIQIDDRLLEALQYLNKSIYNHAKHTIEHVEIDGHMFSVADTLAVYYSCRVMGAELMDGLDLRRRNGDPVI